MPLNLPWWDGGVRNRKHPSGKMAGRKMFVVTDRSSLNQKNLRYQYCSIQALLERGQREKPTSLSLRKLLGWRKRELLHD